MNWYYSKGSERLGPIGETELYQFVESGRLAPQDLVWRPGLPTWCRADTIEGLFIPPPLSLAPIAAASSSPVVVSPPPVVVSPVGQRYSAAHVSTANSSEKSLAQVQATQNREARLSSSAQDHSLRSSGYAQRGAGSSQHPAAAKPTLNHPVITRRTDLPSRPTTLYTLLQIRGAAIFGGPLAGCALMASNFREMGSKKGYLWSLAGGIGVMALFLIVTLHLSDLPDGFPGNLIALGVAATIGQIAATLQGKAISTHIANGGLKQSSWKVTGLTLAWLAATIVGFLGVGAALNVF